MDTVIQSKQSHMSGCGLQDDGDHSLRNRTNKIHIDLQKDTQKEGYKEGLAHAPVEVEKSHNLLSASRRTGGVVSV